jgi:hypothetical protein
MTQEQLQQIRRELVEGICNLPDGLSDSKKHLYAALELIEKEMK